jgi:cytochrome P450
MGIAMPEQRGARFLVPDHVPADLVRDFDIFKVDLGEDPQAAIVCALVGFPRAIYMPRTIRFPDCGSWLLTHEADIRVIMQDAEKFTCHEISSFDAMTEGKRWSALPSEADPPEHAAYRGLLNPLFSPRRVA